MSLDALVLAVFTSCFLLLHVHFLSFTTLFKITMVALKKHHDWKFMALCIVPLPHVQGMSGILPLEFPQSCEQSQQSIADARGLSICELNGTASFYKRCLMQVSICLLFYGWCEICITCERGGSNAESVACVRPWNRKSRGGQQQIESENWAKNVN